MKAEITVIGEVPLTHATLIILKIEDMIKRWDGTVSISKYKPLETER